MKALINTGKTILNALAFSNVGRLSEFQALLAQTYLVPQIERTPDECRPAGATSARPTLVPTVKHIHQPH
jgi:hypothetical protein